MIKAAREPAKTALGGGAAADRRRSDLSRAEKSENPFDLPCLAGHVSALPNETTTELISSRDPRSSTEARQDYSQVDKRSGNTTNGKDKIEKVGVSKIKKGEVVVDKEDIQNLTLTIILERDDENTIMNFPKGFEPRPSVNATEFTLIGMDAFRYIERIQEEARASELSIFRRTRDAR